MDRLRALAVFRQVVELGSFAKAARHLRLSPAAVSKNIGELEAHLAVRLFNRTTRRMSLTEAGRLYHERVVRILDDLEEADSALGPLQQRPSGLLRVSAPMTTTLFALSRAIPEFLERYPEITLDLRMDDRRVDVVEEGFDIALRGSDRLENSSLIARKLLTLRHAVCCAPVYLEQSGRPIHPQDLRSHNCVQFTLSDHADEWSFHNNGETVNVPVNGRYKVGSSLAVRDALRAGFGISLIPRLYVEEDLATGRLVSVLDDWSPVETTLYAVYPSNRHVQVKLRAFLDFAIETFGRLEEGGKPATPPQNC
ncbi:LysR family transcriptional regulator [Nitratireductor indicus]|uniref:LysR family transcriptional regulator n=1 Tax=Nitratireductor indicus TaxID=721133 RepID=UPI002875F9FF|nr:LysR substrate-binding domain-containing protein [Nitratireductor indicus]MDS1135522.1 LysR substrate-binding domain-containing protein [Nitratireductor indicus]